MEDQTKTVEMVKEFEGCDVCIKTYLVPLAPCYKALQRLPL